MTSIYDKRTLEGFGKIVRHFAPLDLLKTYPCDVSQNADGTFEVKADDPRIGSVSRVPARHGAPGEKIKMAKRGRALLAFEAGEEGGDETKPYLVGWADGEVEERQLRASKLTQLRSAVVEVGEGAKRKIAGVGDFVKLPMMIQGVITLGAPGAVGPAALGAPTPFTITFIIPVMAAIASGSSSGKVR